MVQEKLAKLISIVLGPFIYPVTLVVVLLKTKSNINQIAILLPALFFLQIIIPYGYIYFAYKRKKIGDWDLTKKEERHVPLIITFFSLLLSLVLVYFLGNQLLTKLMLLTTILLIINGVITVFWKISLHMATNVAAFLIIKGLDYFSN